MKVMKYEPKLNQSRTEERRKKNLKVKFVKKVSLSFGIKKDMEVRRTGKNVKTAY